MDHGFNDRVDKVFGSISSSSSSTPWSLTDAQVERRPWNRDECRNRDDDQIPVFSSFHNLFNCQTKSLDDDGLQIENDWDIRSSIGLDSTLDNEEEEDAYDKMAEGRENAGGRLYMKDVTDHGAYLNSHNVLPRSTHDVKRDPRANHDAAKTRLKEDDDAVQGSDEHMLNAEASEEDGIRIKSILKRKSDDDNDEVVKQAKRVRFDPTCKNDDAIQLQGFAVPQGSENGGPRSVPDYILNPSKYTRYTFDDSSHDGSNSEAYFEFLDQVKKSKHVGLEQKTCGELAKSIVFIPRKKRGDAAACEGQVKQQSSAKAAAGSSIAALEVQQGEISEMQESHVDDVGTEASSQKPLRQYRAKMEEFDDDVS